MAAIIRDFDKSPPSATRFAVHGNPVRGVPLAPGVPGADLVPELVQRIASTRLVGSPQLTRFLEFIVAESLAGRGDALKAFTIATEGLGRPPDFDPARDPIVRVEATRLRATLSAYFGEEGRDEPIRLRLARGSYQPLVEVIRDASAATPAPLMSVPATWSREAAGCELTLLSRYRKPILIGAGVVLAVLFGALVFNAAMLLHINDHLHNLLAQTMAGKPN